MSDADRSLVQRAAGIAVELFEWIRDSLSSDAARREILEDLGVEVTSAPPLVIPDERLDSIDLYRERQDADYGAFLSAFGDIVNVLEAIDAFISSNASGPREEIEELTYQLVTLLGTDYARLRYPRVSYAAQLARVFLDRPEQIKQALEVLEAPADVEWASHAVLLPLGILLSYFDLGLPRPSTLYGWDVGGDSPTPVADGLARGMLSLQVQGKKSDTDGGSVTGKLGATIAWVPEDHGGPGLLIALNGSDEVTAPLSKNWRLKVKFASTGAVDFLIWDSVTVNGPADASATATIETTRKTEQGPYILGVAKATRLEIGKFTITMQLGATGASIKAVAKKSSLVMQVAEADPFVEQSIPAREVRFDFDLGLGLSSDRGIFLEGGSGLKLSLPLNRSIGPVRLRQLLVSLGGGPSGKAVQMEFLSTLDVKLGAVTATVDRLGFAAAADPKKRNPPTFGFKGPSGIGLVIDCPSVKGAGYLFYDADAGQYAGAVQLDIKGKLTLSAVGVITTKKPDGTRGYSLLIIVNAADFKPINLPFGFRLRGVGGLLGLNRTANVEALRAGLKNRSLDAILFPENPVADAPRIITVLQTVMPARDGQFMVGLMGRFTWPPATIVTIELGLVLEFPDPWRLLILGQIRVLLPSEQKVLVQLQMDVLGVIDWDRDEISIDAVLYDSHVLKQPLTGEMALRARWTGDPTFLLAIGGFHPNFTPPAGFPRLARAAMTVNRGDSIRLRLEAYFALTSNTVQVGARVDLRVRASGFSVEGYLGFDSLFQFEPFMFVVDIRAGITLKWHGRTLCGVDLELTLSGPSPWHARGRATFKIWRFSKSVSFDRVCGADQPPPLPSPVDPMPALLEALADTRNWGTRLPGRAGAVLTLREQRATGEVLVHPLGEVSVQQRVVPLGITIERFGNATPAGDRRFTIDVAAGNGAAAGTAHPVLDFFAPAQFLEMSDATKLRRPSFERMQAGIRVGGGFTFGGDADAALVGDAPIDYETFIPGVDGDDHQVTPLDVDEDELYERITVEAYRPPVQLIGNAKFEAPPLGVGVMKAWYVVASTRDLAPVALRDIDEAGAPSYTAAAQALWKHEEEQPHTRGELQVITVFREEGATP
ncbi:MAG: DUF6603 domain-containing protein [Longimicrobiales bacterium]